MPRVKVGVFMLSWERWAEQKRRSHFPRSPDPQILTVSNNIYILLDVLMGSKGLEKYFNSILPIWQVTLKFCLPGALPSLPKFSSR